MAKHRKVHCVCEHAGPEYAAVVLAADRAVDVMSRPITRSWWEHEKESPELRALVRAVLAARVARDKALKRA